MSCSRASSSLANSRTSATIWYLGDRRSRAKRAGCDHPLENAPGSPHRQENECPSWQPADRWRSGSAPRQSTRERSRHQEGHRHGRGTKARGRASHSFAVTPCSRGTIGVGESPLGQLEHAVIRRERWFRAWRGDGSLDPLPGNARPRPLVAQTVRTLPNGRSALARSSAASSQRFSKLDGTRYST